MRILIADDESIIRLGLKSMLNEMGHEVLTATNGREALQMAHRHRPDLVILDIKMPYTDGLQAARTLAKTNPLPVLLLTAFSDQALIEEAADLPIQGYLIKPVRPEELQAAITVATRRFGETKSWQQRAEALADELETRKLIERAKGKLMSGGMTEQEAYRAIQTQARDERQSMRQVALSILKK